ncbi:MAG: bifunctional diaminohydroxyphosphoribosylaminopyrimidine deaminase/5-amino-6-(5-phosphoribosylamino)uracil reductase RibD [SAR202 cluster bacterium]|nr:bifunctional diaminohydroxyphosphoribosylaminopyrimidine deaminase/5-amino-6-(5-phosphoribosylamino)uracil reductase RibD [SAR202 cluster bacterium]
MDYMQRAFTLALGVQGTTSPNPAVGAVIVKDGRILGQGATQLPGQAHAEIVALRQAGDSARGATLYLTLEPHCFQGRTPPCTRAIIDAGIKEVHIAALDPNPRVNGRGKSELEAAGIKVILGESSQEIRELYEAFAKHIHTGLPFVIAKFAMSLDGKTATRAGHSQWVTGPDSRALVHDLRRASDAVMVGVNTVLRDNPRLTARGAQGQPLSHQPLRVIIDSNARTPTNALLLREPGKTLVAVTDASPVAIKTLESAGAGVIKLPREDGLVSLKPLLQELGRRNVVSLLVEGGGTLLGSLVDQALVDKILAFIAPVIIGGKDALSPVEGQGIDIMSHALRLDHVSVQQIGDDVLIKGYPKPRS